MQLIKKLLFDIETTGLLDFNSIDYSTMPYKIKASYKTHCIVAKDLDTNQVFKFINNGIIDTIPNFLNLIRKYNVIVGHNILNFDLLSLKLTHNLKYEVNPNIHKRLNINDPLESFPDRLFGEHVKFIDTLILSKLLNPDRLGGHSLKKWGERLEDNKGSYGEQENAWDKFSQEMLDYCEQDVHLNHKVYKALLKEMGDRACDWQEAYQLEAAVCDLVTRASHFGFRFDKEHAEWCLNDLNEKIKTLEEDVNPQLPKRNLPKSKQLLLPKSIWKIPFDVNSIYKKTGGLKKSVVDYLNKINVPEHMQEDYICSMLEKKEIDGVSIVNNYILDEIDKHPDLLTISAINFGKKLNLKSTEDIYNKILEIECTGEIPILNEPMTLDHIDDLKQHIMSLGWVPTKFENRDLLLNSKKKKRNRKEVIKAIEKYVNDTIGSQYEKYRCEYLKCVPGNLKEYLLNKSKKAKRLLVLSTPKYVVDQEKNICPNLEKLKEEIPFIDKVIKFMVYRHRRNNILNTSGGGFLANKRINVDGHIPTPADTLGAVTGRFTHKDVANIARVSTLYGKHMRSLFTVDENHFLLTADADGLENRMEGSFCYKYEDGPEYAEKLEAAKPNDWHTVFSKKLNIDRNAGKSVKYGLSYGQQVDGLAKNMGWSKVKAKRVFDGFWEEAPALKGLKDALEAHWEYNGKKYIIGHDNRLLHARAKHLLVNLLFQSSGILCMKRQHIILDRLLKDEGLLGDPFNEDLSKVPKSTLIILYHDESSQQIHKDLVRLKSFDTKKEAEECKRTLEQKGWVLSDINHGIPEICDGKYFIAYSKVITLTSKSMEMAGEYYNMELKLTQAGCLGVNWSHTH